MDGSIFVHANDPNALVVQREVLEEALDAIWFCGKRGQGRNKVTVVQLALFDVEGTHLVAKNGQLPAFVFELRNTGDSQPLNLLPRDFLWSLSALLNER